MTFSMPHVPVSVASTSVVDRPQSPLINNLSFNIAPHTPAGYYGGGGGAPLCTGGGGSSSSRNVTAILNSAGQAAPGHGSVVVTVTAWRNANVTQGHALERAYTLLSASKTPSVLWGSSAGSLTSSLVNALSAGIGSMFGGSVTTGRVCGAGSFVNGSTCVPCGAGNYNTQLDSPHCSNACPEGTYSLTGSSTCHSCPVNTYSTVGRTACRPCVAGTVSAEFSSHCTPCAAGTYASPGSRCTLCAAGTFSLVGASVCAPCGTGSFSSPGASGCDACSA
jgi:hypothetical protein